ncbi:hypothetical protein [Salipiger sp. PrR003]|uniref:hypothetical protein n=1 Tax=Salipiger sp. PrR003 TaxID=2706776 RepID=UPI0013DA3AD6|nr:hypothetical protein [Salipiger sp. PrR003]NDV51638.1 hypothetical protein [Salipiger sp. PrR003]
MADKDWIFCGALKVLHSYPAFATPRAMAHSFVTDESFPATLGLGACMVTASAIGSAPSAGPAARNRSLDG